MGATTHAAWHAQLQPAVLAVLITLLASPVAAAGHWKLLWAEEFNDPQLNQNNWNYEIGTGYESGEDVGWDLLWEDEFDGAQLNDINWNYETGTGCQYLSENYPMCGWGNAEYQYYSFNNARTENGNLVIEARKEEDGTLTSARLTTFGKYSIRPNNRWTTIRVRAKIKLPQGQGLWPAFWMIPSLNATCLGCGKYGRWAASGEIDIMEAKNEMGTLYGTTHFGSSWPNNKFHEATLPAELAENWHTYSVEWEKQEIRWYFNGQLYSTQRSCNGVPGPDCWFSTGEGAGPDSPFDQPFHIVLNMALGGRFSGNIPFEVVSQTLESPKQMQVDWVRVHGKRADL